MSILNSFTSSSLTGSLTFGGTFLFVYTPFSRFEEIQSDQNRAFFANWIKGTATSKFDVGLNSFYVEFFSKFFGKKHLSLSCIWRSVLMSFIIFWFVVGTWWYHHPIKFFNFKLELFTDRTHEYLFSAIVGFGCLCDYLTLLKTRILLKKINSIAKHTSIPGLILLDAATTIAFYYIGFTIVGIWFQRFVLGMSVSWTDITTFGTTLFTDTDDDPFPAQLLLLCAILTSAWLWGYVLGTLIVRVLKAASFLMRYLPKIVDIDGHPVRSIGFIVAAFAAVLTCTMSEVLSII